MIKCSCLIVQFNVNVCGCSAMCLPSFPQHGIIKTHRSCRDGAGNVMSECGSKAAVRLFHPAVQC